MKSEIFFVSDFNSETGNRMDIPKSELNLVLTFLLFFQIQLSPKINPEQSLYLNRLSHKCLPVMRHMVGKADKSKLDLILGKAASYSATKWEVAQVSAVAEAVNRVVLSKVKDINGVNDKDVCLAAQWAASLHLTLYQVTGVPSTSPRCWFGTSNRSWA